MTGMVVIGPSSWLSSLPVAMLVVFEQLPAIPVQYTVTLPFLLKHPRQIQSQQSPSVHMWAADTVADTIVGVLCCIRRVRPRCCVDKPWPRSERQQQHPRPP